MDNLTKLFIRACKSNDPDVRLESVYRRFYLPSGTGNRIHITTILMDICESYSLVTISKLIGAMSPENAWKYAPEDADEPEYSYVDAAYNALVSFIRFSPIDRLPGLPRPAWLRNRFPEA